jgi:hypothetical protein
MRPRCRERNWLPSPPRGPPLPYVWDQSLLREDKTLANRFLRSDAAVESIRKQKWRLIPTSTQAFGKSFARGHGGRLSASVAENGSSESLWPHYFAFGGRSASLGVAHGNELGS